MRRKGYSLCMRWLLRMLAGSVLTKLIYSAKWGFKEAGRRIGGRCRQGSALVGK